MDEKPIWFQSTNTQAARLDRLAGRHHEGAPLVAAFGCKTGHTKAAWKSMHVYDTHFKRTEK
ncbi:MAG: hypothetical protein LBP52_06830 [Burkholderiaceae bacterium]|nr:hypothetical protein [Burkholderiaceae bacterium]